MYAAAMSKDIVDATVRGVHSHLMAYAHGRVNDDPLACMFATWRSGGGALPDWMGLCPEDFKVMMNHHFPGVPYEYPEAGHAVPVDRHDEVDELYKLMVMHRANQSVSEAWVAKIVAFGCMGSDHLWQDLGLWSRPDLTGLMNRNFPTLRNEKNMKWKKYLYKQLCEAEGIYTCRSPSCEVCVDYQACFASED